MMSDPLRSPVTQNLRLLKEHRGVTWTAVARGVDRGERLVAGWASEDEGDPSWPNLCRLAEFFGVQPCFFYLPPVVADMLLRGDIGDIAASNFFTEEAAPA